MVVGPMSAPPGRNVLVFAIVSGLPPRANNVGPSGAVDNRPIVVLPIEGEKERGGRSTFFWRKPRERPTRECTRRCFEHAPRANKMVFRRSPRRGRLCQLGGVSPEKTVTQLNTPRRGRLWLLGQCRPLRGETFLYLRWSRGFRPELTMSAPPGRWIIVPLWFYRSRGKGTQWTQLIFLA